MSPPRRDVIGGSRRRLRQPLSLSVLLLLYLGASPAGMEGVKLSEISKAVQELKFSEFCRIRGGEQRPQQAQLFAFEQPARAQADISPVVVAVAAVLAAPPVCRPASRVSGQLGSDINQSPYLACDEAWRQWRRRRRRRCRHFGLCALQKL